jgi:hypothetical protein
MGSPAAHQHTHVHACASRSTQDDQPLGITSMLKFDTRTVCSLEIRYLRKLMVPKLEAWGQTGCDRDRVKEASVSLENSTTRISA